MIIIDPLYNKIIQNTYNDMIKFDVMYHYLKESEQGVMWKPSVQRFDLDLGINTAKICNELANFTYRSKGFTHFVITERGKWRDIHSVHIYERAVQKALCNVIIKPAVVPRLLNTNCASLRGRGTSYALSLMKRHLSEAYRKFGKDCYISIMDYHSYYNSIIHNKLLKMFRNWIEDDYGYMLFEYFIRANDYRGILLDDSNKYGRYGTKTKKPPTIEYFINSDKLSIQDTISKGIYDKKYLSYVDDNIIKNADDHIINDISFGSGLGLGSEVSQIASISYTNEIDHKIKELYKIFAYTKYMDDSYMIDPDLGKLKETYSMIVEESANLGLKLNPKSTNFYKITDYYEFLKKSVHVVPDTGKVIMRLNGEAVTKHRNLIYSQYKLVMNNRISFETAFYSFYGWRQSMKLLDSYNNLKELTYVFYNLYKHTGFINKIIHDKLFTI